LKKFVLLATLLASTAFAGDLTVQTGRDQKFKKDVVKYSYGTDVAGLNVHGNIANVRDGYTSYGVTAGKTIPVGPVGIEPTIGAAYVRPAKGDAGYVAQVGLNASVSLGKNASFVAGINRNFDLKDGKAFTGNQVTGGIKVTF
jgi:hypothetical protein